MKTYSLGCCLVALAATGCMAPAEKPKETAPQQAVVVGTVHAGSLFLVEKTPEFLKIDLADPSSGARTYETDWTACLSHFPARGRIAFNTLWMFHANWGIDVGGSDDRPQSWRVDVIGCPLGNLPQEVSTSRVSSKKVYYVPSQDAQHEDGVRRIREDLLFHLISQAESWSLL